MELGKRTLPLKRRTLYWLLVIGTGVSGTLIWMTSQRAAESPAAPTVALVEASSSSANMQQNDPEAMVATSPQATEDTPIHSQLPPPKLVAYEVVPGDTVERIAELFGILPESILASNQTEHDTILQIGQQLLIPTENGLLYTTKEGDTFWDIAVTFGIEVDQIIRSNTDVSPDSLQAGQVLLLPGAERPRDTFLASRGGTASRSDILAPAPEPEPEPEPEPPPAPSDLLWPLRGTITEYFGWRTHPVYGTPNFHEGIDIGVPQGTDVVAIASGTVVLSEWYGGYGLTVKVDHGNGMISRYSHNSVLLVEPGTAVTAGQAIARSGNTGVSTGPHLDFGIYMDGQPVDPFDFLP